MSLKVYQSNAPKYAGHTPGPWEVQWEYCECEPPCGCDNPYPYKILAPSRKVSPYKNNPDWKESAEIVDFMEVNVPLPVPEPRANAALIADAPYLACEVERLRELCGELVKVLDEFVSANEAGYRGSVSSDDPAKEVIDYAIPVWRDELIARIDPEPVEEREYWRVKYERYRDTPDGKGYFTSCTDASPTREIAVERYERRLPNPDTTILMVKDAFIEHIRESVLSREEVKP